MERLKRYGIFSDETLRVVEAVAKKQATFTRYQDYFASLGMSEPTLYIGSKRRGVPVIDIASRENMPKGTIVVHLPMSNPLDENQLFHIATIASALPEYRIISFGNVSAKPYNYRAQNRTIFELYKIAFTNRREALVSAEIDYLHAQGIVSAHHVGYSYGAHKALIEAEYLGDEAASLTLVDPVAHSRGIKQLIHDFRSTLAPMSKYVDRTNLPIYFDARRVTSETGHYKGALRRSMSVAVGILLARLDFIPYLKKVLTANKSTKLVVAWGTKSELGNDAYMKASVHQLANEYPGRVRGFGLKDDEHAMANDIHLYAALVYEAVRGYNVSRNV